MLLGTLRTHQIALHVNNNDAFIFDSFRFKYIPQEIRNLIGNNKIIKNIFRIQPNDSIRCGYFCIGFINFMYKGKLLTDFRHSFLPNSLDLIELMKKNNNN